MWTAETCVFDSDSKNFNVCIKQKPVYNRVHSANMQCNGNVGILKSEIKKHGYATETEALVLLPLSF